MDNTINWDDEYYSHANSRPLFGWYLIKNLRAIYRDYEILGDDLWERFNVKEKTRHKWYYSSIAKEIKQLKDTREYKEYKELLKLFN